MHWFHVCVGNGNDGVGDLAGSAVNSVVVDADVVRNGKRVVIDRFGLSWCCATLTMLS